MSNRAPIRRIAAFAPTSPPTPRCPSCWSAPFLGQSAKTRRGWSVQAVASTIYPCSNAQCTTAIVVRMALTGGYLETDLATGLIRHDAAAAFVRGRTARDGIWRDRTGDPKTAPVQRDLFGS